MNKSPVRSQKMVTVVCLFTLLLYAGTGNCLDNPAGPMQSAVEEIMAILKDSHLKLPENKQCRRQLILAVVRHHFNFEEMSKMTLGIHWKEITDQEKEHFVETFSQLIENSYIKKIEAYSDEQVIFLKESVRDNKALVPTLIRHNNIDIPINYKLLKEEDRWLVYDVVIEGVSLIQNYRTQFNSIITKEKYAGLVRRVDEKLGEMASERE